MSTTPTPPLDGETGSPSSSTLEKDVILVQWDGSDDREDPRNWSTLKRGTLSVIAAMVVLNATFSSSAPSAISDDLMDYFGFGTEIATLNISIFVAGYAVGPILWGPLSEQKGRRFVFLLSMFLYTSWNVGCALSRNTASILIFRLFAGACASASQSNSGGLISDLYPARTRGIAMGIYAAAPLTGPALGPIVGGFIQTSGASWRWLFWTLTMYSGACFVVVLFIPETYAPVLLRQKAQRLRKVTGDPRYKSSTELKQQSILSLTKTVLTKPFRIVWEEPMLQAIILYQSYIFGLLYLLFEALPIVFQECHHFSQGIGGLMFLPFTVGGFAGVAVYVFILYPRYTHKVDKSSSGVVAPEARLPMSMIGGPFIVVGFFWFGWTSYPSVSYWAPLMSTSLLGFGFFLIFGGLMNYIVDAYTANASSALAASTIFRSLIGAAFPLFARQMYDRLGTQWASSLLGFLSALMVPIPFVLYRYGPTLRSRSKNTVS
ncbi:hypothetical protein CBS101457_004936 [Exobasidium rhododendri]|nr:hypothetical protein CBS101457_004936 [Exobasidium rhododendri]